MNLFIAGSLPQNIHVLDPAMRPAVMGLLAASPTFRRQCETIGGTPNVSVTIGKPVAPLRSYSRSRLTVRTYDTGLRAHIELPPLARAEVLAHDLEQVVGRLDRATRPDSATAARAYAAQRAARRDLRHADDANMR